MPNHQPAGTLTAAPHCGSHCHQLRVFLTLQFLWRQANVGPDIYVLNFQRAGITIHGGHEAMVHEAWLGANYFGTKNHTLLEARAAPCTSRSVRRALLMPQVIAGSIYRCGKRT